MNESKSSDSQGNKRSTTPEGKPCNEGAEKDRAGVCLRFVRGARKALSPVDNLAGREHARKTGQGETKLGWVTGRHRMQQTPV